MVASENLKSVSSTTFRTDASTESVDVEEESHSEKDEEYEESIKNKILEASLNFVAEHGWTKAAIVAGKLSKGRKLNGRGRFQTTC